MEDVYPCERDIVKLEDGGQIAIDWIQPPELDKFFNKRTPIVVFLPGLTGDRFCQYSKIIIKEIAYRKFKPVILNHRGCGYTQITTRNLISNSLARFYSAATIEDTRAGFEYIHKKYPENPVYGVGVSMGGTILGNVSNLVKLVCGSRG